MMLDVRWLFSDWWNLSLKDIQRRWKKQGKSEKIWPVLWNYHQGSETITPVV